VQPGGVVTVSQSAGWTVTWTPANSATSVLVTIGNHVGEIKCVVAESAGTATVPPTLLSRLPTGNSNSIEIENVAVSTASSPNATVEVGAFNEVFAFAVVQP